tara:strand:- start:322 stop:843 length:522 start_codon:yes stop_codon:yes gene_type:complete
MNDKTTLNRNKLINSLGVTEELTRTTQRLHEVISNLMRDPRSYPVDTIKTQLSNINKTLGDLQGSLDNIDMNNLVNTEDILFSEPSNLYEGEQQDTPVLPEVPVQETTQVEEVPETARTVTSQVVERGRDGAPPPPNRKKPQQMNASERKKAALLKKKEQSVSRKVRKQPPRQ